MIGRFEHPYHRVPEQIFLKPRKAPKGVLYFPLNSKKVAKPSSSPMWQ